MSEYEFGFERSQASERGKEKLGASRGPCRVFSHLCHEFSTVEPSFRPITDVTRPARKGAIGVFRFSITVEGYIDAAGPAFHELSVIRIGTFIEEEPLFSGLYCCLASFVGWRYS